MKKIKLLIIFNQLLVCLSSKIISFYISFAKATLQKPNMKNQLKLISLIVVLTIFNACATYKTQFKTQDKTQHFPKNKDISHSFYLVGDAGNTPLGKTSNVLQQLETTLNKASQQSTLVFLGDNIYPSGLAKKGKENRAFGEHQLNLQTAVVKNFKGQTLFIPGNHDWYSDGLEGLKRQQKYIENILGKNSFLPKNGCPIKKVNISDDIVMIVVDSQWYLTDWNKHPNINNDCEIKTRNRFFDEFESLIKKARGKTTLIAMHHPMFSNGPHGGQYAFKQHLTPTPVLGTLKNILRKTGGVSPADLQNKIYNEFKNRIVTLSQENDKVIFMSGHEHSLQYIIEDNLPQIVSGSGSKTSATRNVNGGLFSSGSTGYARLDVFTDGSSYIRFYDAKDNNVIFQTQVLSPNDKVEVSKYNATIPPTKTAAVYNKEETNKNTIYKKLLGKRYRDYYSTNVTVPTVNLDTLYGGLVPTRKGGGHQSKSLRLEDAEGREYVMRAVRKNALQYLQAVAFKDQYIEGQFDDTYTEGLLQDVFTGSHPYAPLAVGTLAEAAGVYHTNPVLYYVPKQNTLGEYNDNFGDELYIIEERAADGHGDKSSFGFSNELISTNDMLKNLQKNENHKLDEAAYIRARLFDMLIGDWDRHQDQWRWAVFKDNETTIYRPVPRDRDQAFSIMSDGILLGIATAIIPDIRLLRSYSEDIKSVKWFNLEPYPLDITLINIADQNLWNAQVKRITENVTDQIINQAFTNLPKEVNDETIEEIKTKLKGRRTNLQKISDTYFKHLNKYAIVKGTNKDDRFEVERLPNGITKVSGYRMKKGEKAERFFERTYNRNTTKEIWIYALGNDDEFKVYGEGDKMIPLRLIGGQNKDTYNIVNGKRVKLYDHKSRESNFVTKKGIKRLTDDYEINAYDYSKFKNNSNQFIPTIGANPDDGFKVGFVNTYTVSTYNFKRNPFISKHTLSGSYFFATSGYDLALNSEFSRIVGKWSLAIDAAFTSPNFSRNFFGFGNSTSNSEPDDDAIDLDFNRVRIRNINLSPSLIWRGRLGATFKIGGSYESIEVENTQGRFINTNNLLPSEVFNTQDFLGINASYYYKNKDNPAFPTLGMEFGLDAGYKTNIDNSNGFAYLVPSLGVDYKLIPSGQLVLASKVKGYINFGDDFEFYQAATLGANNGLRGYRNERFTGKSSFYQSTDLRLNLRKVKTGLLPLNIGIYGGFDYGRVWIDSDEFAIQNSFNDNSLNTSVGGGVFLNAANKITGNISLFNSDDDIRFAFAIGFGF